MTPPIKKERVLSTLNVDGTRRWLFPRVARGRFLRARRITGFALIVLFVLLPRIRIGGRPAILIDLISREVSVFGGVFRPSDGFVLMLLGLAIVLAVFLGTALVGRIWCGWACPQTVYLEHVFRPIERWLEGSPANRERLQRSGALRYRRAIKIAIYAALSFALANVFLAYFVGTDRLETWVFGSPLDHIAGFTVVMAVSGLMLLDFTYFREQTCIVACPYGRLQSVLLDRQSLIVGYDAKRGEPRGKPKQKLPVVGDCVDCGGCVDVCPTGIDIRDGLQMECVGCAQCIDACDAVMDKLGRKRGLIGYTSQDKLAGIPARLLRVRTVIYPALLALACTLLVWSVASKSETDVTLERIQGPTFVELPNGMIAAQVRIKLENESDIPRTYKFSLAESGDAQLRLAQPEWRVEPRKSMVVPFFVDLPRGGFHDGKRNVYLRIVDNTGFHSIMTVTLLGPEADHEERHEQKHDEKHDENHDTEDDKQGEHE